LADSFTASGGQFCTKPGLVFIPDGPQGDALTGSLAATVSERPPYVLLNARITDGYRQGIDRLTSQHSVDVLATGIDGSTHEVSSLLATSTADALDPGAVEEIFGPLALVVRYAGLEDLARVLGQLPPSLTATVHAEQSDGPTMATVCDLLEPLTGRLLFDGYPTGVAVAWAQHHGGPWPSTNSQFTSVGAAAVRRFQRPVTWQNAPADILPTELRDDAKDIVRRMDGVLELPRQ
jgi:NADP-dependent aldehyde dehydrogenase